MPQRIGKAARRLYTPLPNLTGNVAVMHLNFSTQAGPRERQLQRRHNNPLFVSAAPVSQQQILSAREQDQKAAQDFMLQFRELVQRVVALDQNAESDTILLIKAQLEQQYAICTGMHGDSSAVQEAAKKLIHIIGTSLRKASQTDPHALEKLLKDEEHTALHLQLCGHAIVSDILNPDEVVAENELVPNLLSESEEALQSALALFPPERIAVMVSEAKDLLGQVEAAGHSLPAAWQRLAQMEKWLHGEQPQ